MLYEDYVKVFDATKTFVMPSDPLTLISHQIVRDSVDDIQDLAVYSWDEVLRQSESGGIVKASSTGYYYGIHCRSFSHFRPRKNNPSVLVDLKLTLDSLTAEFVNCNSLTQSRAFSLRRPELWSMLGSRAAVSLKPKARTMYMVGYHSTAIAGAVTLDLINHRLAVPTFSLVGCDPLQEYTSILTAFPGPQILSLDRKGMDRNTKFAAIDWILDNLSAKFLTTRNGCIDVLSIRKILSYLLRLPVVQPTGHVVHFRERGLQSGLIGLIQHVEGMLTQVATIRPELELYIEQGVWSLRHLGGVCTLLANHILLICMPPYLIRNLSLIIGCFLLIRLVRFALFSNLHPTVYMQLLVSFAD